MMNRVHLLRMGESLLRFFDETKKEVKRKFPVLSTGICELDRNEFHGGVFRVRTGK